MFFGNVRLNGEAHHDVVDFFGNVSVADNSNIGDDLVSFFGSVHLGENVGAPRRSRDLRYGACALVNIGWRRSRPISPWIFFGPILILILVIYLIVHELQTRRHRQFAQYYPMPPRR